MAKKNRKLARQKRQEERQAKRLLKQIKKRQPKQPKQKFIAPKTPKLTQYEQIQNTLNYIQGNPNLTSSQELSTKIVSAIEEEYMFLTGKKDIDVDFQNNRHTALYDIDDNWSGKYNTLINHIHIKQELNSPEARKFLQQVIDRNWGSKEKHEDYLNKAGERSYASNIEGFDIPKNFYAIIEQIMNDSGTWHIIGDRHGLGTQDYDSTQAKKDWTELHKDVTELMRKPKNVTAKDIGKLLKMVQTADTMATKSQKVGEEMYNDLKEYVEDLLKKV